MMAARRCEQPSAGTIATKEEEIPRHLPGPGAGEPSKQSQHPLLPQYLAEDSPRAGGRGHGQWRALHNTSRVILQPLRPPPTAVLHAMELLLQVLDL